MAISDGQTARFPFPILALTLSAFAVGTAEFVIAGLLPDIARDLDVTIPAAGQLVTGYAIGVVIGAPTLAIATSRMPRKRVLLAMLGIFIVGNLLSAVAPNYAWLMAARVLAALAHGSLFGAGIIIAAALVPPNKRASAIALLFSGLTIANVVGVPLGAFVGQSHGWRVPFLAITVLGIVSLVAAMVMIPEVDGGGPIDARREFAAARRPAALLAFANTVFSSACVFAIFTYVVPILEDVGGYAPGSATIILFIVGVGLTIGINLGGRLADSGVMRALTGLMAMLAILSALLAFASQQPIAAVVVVFLWGMVGFAAVPALQARALDTAREAPNMASALNVGAFNLGNAGGALLGGAVIGGGLGLRAVPLAAAVMALLGLAAALGGAALDRRAAR